MSSASAELLTFHGAHVAYAVYSGTSDVLAPNLSPNPEKAWDYEKGRCHRADKRNAWDVLSDCDHDTDEGYIYSSYGGGFYWPVKYCLRCMVVHGPLSPWEVLEDSDAPEGWMGVWPKDGRPPIEGTVASLELPAGSS